MKMKMKLKKINVQCLKIAFELIERMKLLWKFGAIQFDSIGASIFQTVKKNKAFM